jgi:FMN phosphatase YigB (HAD superfamily)
MLGLAADRCVIIGDRLSTDIAMAAAAGMDSASCSPGDDPGDGRQRPRRRSDVCSPTSTASSRGCAPWLSTATATSCG